MQLLLVEGENIAVKSLYKDEPVIIPEFYPTTYPLEVAIVRRIENPTTGRLFDPVDTSAYTVQVGLGVGFKLPTAGVWQAGWGTLTSGTITSGKRYRITNFVSGDSFLNVGAGSNATGQFFTATGTTPTTWSNGSTVIEITTDLDFDNTAAELQSALNVMASIAAAGGVTVTGENGLFTITFVTAGSREEIQGFEENLAPDSTVDPGTVINGSTLLREIQTLRLTQDPVGLKTLNTTITAATATPTEVVVGGSGANAQWRIAITPAPYGGSMTIEIGGMVSGLINYDAAAASVVTALEALAQTSGTIETGQKYKIVTYVAGDSFTNVGAGSNATGVVFTATGTTPTTWTNGSTLTSVGSGNVSCVKETPTQWLLMFIGDMAETDMISIAVEDASLLSIAGRKGTMDARTAGADLLLGNESTVPVTLEIKCTPSGGTETITYRQDSILASPIIPPTSEATVPMGGIYDRVTGDGPYRFVIDSGVIGYDNF